jgi:hypothetical protein
MLSTLAPEGSSYTLMDLGSGKDDEGLADAAPTETGRRSALHRRILRAWRSARLPTQRWLAEKTCFALMTKPVQEARSAHAGTAENYFQACPANGLFPNPIRIRIIGTKETSLDVERTADGVRDYV